MKSLRSQVATLLALFATCIASATAQMPPPRYTPAVDLTEASYIRTLAHLPNGKIVVGANDLQRVNGFAISNLARLNADGSLDATWNPAPNSGVGALYVDAAGMLYVGGFFTSIAGHAQTSLARFNAAGVLDENFHPQFDGGVNAIAPGLAGTICVGGTFTHINASAHNHLGCISVVDGSEVAAFTPDVNNIVIALTTVGNNLYVAGYFSMIGSTARFAVARMPLNGNGTPDAWDAKVNASVYAILPGAPGEIYLAGGFSFVGTTPRRGVAKLNDITGAPIAAFDVQAPSLSSVFDIVSDGTGGLIAAGSFTALGGQPRLNIARLDATTGAAITGFNPGIDYGYANRLAAVGDGSFLVAGQFSSLGGGEHLGIGHVFGDGSVDALFDSSLETRGYAYAIRQLPGNGGFVVAGHFARANGLIRRNLFKLSPPNRVDPNWIAHTNADVYGLEADDIGRVYISGYFTRVGNTARSYLARLQNTSDGALDLGWNPQPNSPVTPILLRPEGLYAAGGFSTIGGGSQSLLARLSTVTGNLDTGWKPVFGGGYGVIAMAATSAGDLLLSGLFTSLNGTATAGAAKLGTAASAVVDPSWLPDIKGGYVYKIAVNGDDVYLGGTFTAVDGTTRTGLARLSASGVGTLDAGWAPAIDGYYPYAILPQPEGVYVGGYFTGINGSGVGYLTRLDKSGEVDKSWQPGIDYIVYDLLRYRESVIAAGYFSVPHAGVVRLPAAGDTLFVDDFDG